MLTILTFLCLLSPVKAQYTTKFVSNPLILPDCNVNFYQGIDIINKALNNNLEQGTHKVLVDESFKEFYLNKGETDSTIHLLNKSPPPINIAESVF